MYNSLFENNKVSFKEASFGTQVKDRMFQIFGSILSKRIGKSVYSSNIMSDLFSRDGDVFGGVFYYISDGERLRINVNMGESSTRPYSIDYWPPGKISNNRPFVSVIIPETMNLVEMMSYMTELVKQKGRVSFVESFVLEESVSPKTIQDVTDWIISKGYDIPYLLKLKADVLMKDYNSSGFPVLDLEDFGTSLNRYLQSQGVHYAKLKRFRRGANKPKDGKAPKAKPTPKSIKTPVAVKPPVSKPVLSQREQKQQEMFSQYKVYNTDLKGTINLLVKLTRRVGSGTLNGLLVMGTPGVGKTYTVKDVLKKDFGMTENVDYVFESGGETSPIAFYRLLYDNSDKLIVMDDNDAIWKNEASVSMIKGALQTEGTRTVTNNKVNVGDYPQRFDFNGQLIFITNLRGADLKLAEPVKTRVGKIVFNISKEEIIRYISSILDKIYPQMDMDVKMEAFEYFDLMGELYTSAADEGLSIRAFTLTLDCIMSGDPDWKQTALNTL